MWQEAIRDFKTLHFTAKLFLVFAVALVMYIALVHMGIVRLPRAQAYDCRLFLNAKIIEIHMKDSQFEPKDISVHVCDTLKFENFDDEARLPAIGEHPKHAYYPGFEPEQAIEKNQVYRVTLDRAGYYTIHDHLHEEMVGTLTITQLNLIHG